MAVDRVAALLMGVLPSYFALLSTDLRELRRYVLAISEALALAILPIAWGTSLVAAEFVPLVLGERWLAAVAPLQILPFYAAFFGLSSLLSQVLRVIGETRFFMICNWITAAGMLLAVQVAAPRGMTAVSWTWVVAYPLLTLPLYVRTFARLQISASDYLRALYPALSSGLVMATAVALCAWLLPAGPRAARLAALVAVGAASYAGCAWLLHGARVRSLLGVVRSAWAAAPASAAP
jgi:O-antigen/teichoic acid export membrane protein